MMMPVFGRNDEIGTSDAWRPISGFEGIYAVSAFGEVYSFRTGRRLKACLDKDGYPRVILRVDGRHYTRKVHRLVADAFHGESRGALYNEVDHIDGNRANANADNLRWVSRGENHHHRRLSGRASKTKESALTADAVAEIRATPKAHGTATKLASKFGVARHVVYDVLRGRTWVS